MTGRMRMPKPAKKTKPEPMREVTIRLPVKCYEVFAKADGEIRREFGETPGVESLMADALTAERKVGDLVHAFRCRMLNKTDRLPVDLALLTDVLKSYIEADREIKKRGGKSPGIDRLMEHVLTGADRGQLIAEFAEAKKPKPRATK